MICPHVQWETVDISSEGEHVDTPARVCTTLDET